MSRQRKVATQEQVAFAVRRFGSKRATYELMRRGLAPPPIAGGAGWAVVQNPAAPATVGSGNITNTFASAVSTGNVIIVGVTWTPVSGTFTISDNATGGTNSYTKIASATDTNNANIGIYVASITRGGGQALTVTIPTAGGGLAMGMMEVSGITTTADTFITKAGTASASPTSGATAATTGANEFAVGVYGNDGYTTTMTPGSGWSAGPNSGASGNEQVDIEYQDSGASGSAITANWTTSGSNIYGAVCAVFQLSGTVATVKPYIPTRMPRAV